ncbi:hypothetical protein V3331_06595 [Gaopeijia maritima]|uniref:hypothetical protein n=1 Tax=Gaopeijia maritima TaxID=3119007 RepID=UPI00324BA26F
MSGLFPAPPPPGGAEGEGLEHVEPERRRDVERRWQVRAAQWRATALAEWAFDGRVVPRLAGRSESAGFRALLELEVPFDGIEGHRESEARFLAAVRRDEHLARMPMVVVFTPRPSDLPPRASAVAESGPGASRRGAASPGAPGGGSE